MTRKERRGLLRVRRNALRNGGQYPTGLPVPEPMTTPPPPPPAGGSGISRPRPPAGGPVWLQLPGAMLDAREVIAVIDPPDGLDIDRCEVILRDVPAPVEVQVPARVVAAAVRGALADTDRGARIGPVVNPGEAQR